MKKCPECDSKMRKRKFNDKLYFFCTKCEHEIVIGEKNKEDTAQDENKKEEKEDTAQDENKKEEKEDTAQDENMKEKIHNMLTPDIIVCNECVEAHSEDILCNKCNIIVLKTNYNGKVYRCPVCEEIFCEKCWEGKA